MTSDRIRGEALKLLASGFLARSVATNRLIFHATRRKSGERPRTKFSIELDSVGSPVLSAQENFPDVREEILVRLIDALEAEEKLSGSR